MAKKVIRKRKRPPPIQKPEPITLADMLATLPGLGPWKLQGPFRYIRNAAGDCPLIAFARLRGTWVGSPIGGGGNPDSGRSIGPRVGFTAEEGEDITDAADGLADTFEKFGFGDDARRIRTIRAALLKACGLKELPRETED